MIQISRKEKPFSMRSRRYDHTKSPILK